MEDFREPPPDPGDDWSPEGANGSGGSSPKLPPRKPPEDPHGGTPEPAEPEPEEPEAQASGDAANAAEPDGLRNSKGPDLRDTDAAASSDGDGDGDNAVTIALRACLGSIVEDARLVAAAEASKLRGMYAMLQDALEHPAVFIPCPAGTERSDLTGEAEGWVRSSLAQEIGAALGITKGQAAAQISDAEHLCETLPATLDALESGQITWRHAATMIRNTIGLDADAAAQFENDALPKAEVQSPTQFGTMALRIREEMFPETITERKAEAAQKRRVDCCGASDGMGTLSIYAPIEIVQSLDNAARHTARALKAAGDDRTQAQIETDTIIDAIMHGFTCDSARPGVGAAGIGADRLGAIRPTVYITVPALTLLGRAEEPAHLDGYGPIDPETARTLAAHAPSFTRLLTHPETGAVISVGRDSYRVPADLRRTIELRDETCVGIGCNRPATTCDLDHRNDWQKGGETSLENVDAECESHHMVKHHTTWQIHTDTNDDIVWTSPLGMTYRVPRTSNVQFANPDDVPTAIRKELPEAPPF